MSLNTKYLRTLKGQNLMNQYSLDTSYIPVVQCYHNATILPYKKGENFNGFGGVIDENGKYVGLSAEKFVFGKYDIELPVIRDETVCYCGYLMHQWGHFLLDSLTRVWYCLEHDNEIEKYVFFTEENNEVQLSGNYVELFKLLGIWDKVEFINKPVRFSKVIIPERGFVGGKYFAKIFLSVFDNISAKAKVDESWEKYDKIYFTRNQYKKSLNADIGFEMLDDYFQKNGFQLIAPERLTLSQLIYIIRHAKVVASGSGSVSHNMLFANHNQKLLLLEKTVLNNDYQVGVNVARDLDVTYIDANLALYSVEIGYGPFMIAYRGKLEEYTKDHNLVPPSEHYTSAEYMLSIFRQYMKQYKKNYHARWIMYDWMVPHIDYLREAYLEGEAYFYDYICGLRPYTFIQHFQLRFIKQAVKRMLKK